jgi:hypothetical protein
MVGGENVESLNGIGQLILCEDRHKASLAAWITPFTATDDEKVCLTQHFN